MEDVGDGWGVPTSIKTTCYLKQVNTNKTTIDIFNIFVCACFFSIILYNTVFVKSGNDI